MADANESGSKPIWFDNCDTSEELDSVDVFLDGPGGIRWDILRDFFLPVFVIPS